MSWPRFCCCFSAAESGSPSHSKTVAGRISNLSAQGQGRQGAQRQIGQNNSLAQVIQTPAAFEALAELNSSSLPGSPSAQALQERLKVPYKEIVFTGEIGKGNYKTVYRGRWNNTHVALVGMRRGGMVTDARVLQRLSNHPNLVQFYRWTTDAKGNEYIITELVAMGSLDKILSRHGTDLKTKLSICEQVCNAMCELTQEGVLHRDLAARNILVHSLDPVQVKVGPPAKLEAGQLETDTVELKVPIRWSPPEVLTRREWSEKSDVWSFGVTVWEIFSNGRDPWPRKSELEVYQAILAGEQLPRPKPIPTPLWELVQQCWHANPEERPTFQQIAEKFDTWRRENLAQKQRVREAQDSNVQETSTREEVARSPPLEGTSRRTASGPLARIDNAMEPYQSLCQGSLSEELSSTIYSDIPNLDFSSDNHNSSGSAAEGMDSLLFRTDQSIARNPMSTTNYSTNMSFDVVPAIEPVISHSTTTHPVDAADHTLEAPAKIGNMALYMRMGMRVGAGAEGQSADSEAAGFLCVSAGPSASATARVLDCIKEHASSSLSPTPSATYPVSGGAAGSAATSPHRPSYLELKSKTDSVPGVTGSDGKGDASTREAAGGPDNGPGTSAGSLPYAAIGIQATAGRPVVPASTKRRSIPSNDNPYVDIRTLG